MGVYSNLSRPLHTVLCSRRAGGRLLRLPLPPPSCLLIPQTPVVPAAMTDTPGAGPWTRQLARKRRFVDTKGRLLSTAPWPAHPHFEPGRSTWVLAQQERPQPFGAESLRTSRSTPTCATTSRLSAASAPPSGGAAGGVVPLSIAMREDFHSHRTDRTTRAWVAQREHIREEIGPLSPQGLRAAPRALPRQTRPGLLPAKCAEDKLHPQPWNTRFQSGSPLQVPITAPQPRSPSCSGRFLTPSPSSPTLACTRCRWAAAGCPRAAKAAGPTRRSISRTTTEDEKPPAQSHGQCRLGSSAHEAHPALFSRSSSGAQSHTLR